MSVGRSVGTCFDEMMELLTDEHSVRSTLDGISPCNNSILVLIGQLKSAAHWLTEISCSLTD